MQLHGQQLIGKATSAERDEAFTATNPQTGETLAPRFHEASTAEAERAVARADEAFDAFAQTSPDQRAGLLEAIADQLEALGDDLLDRTHAETALPMKRLQGERARAVNQTKLFAQMIREGSWVEARIDRGDPSREPMPKPDVRRMLVPIGPVAVFGASNFPLAISVAGTDTISALGAGCPVVVKAHPGHPGTCEMIARAILEAVDQTGMPDGVFSLVHGTGSDVGQALVKHPATKAVGFTGSQRGGRAIFDAAASRPEPIPVYAEMGSVNPVFVLPGALKERADEIAQGYIQSVTLGAGQFCTNPGLVLGLGGEPLERFTEAATRHAAEAAPATMLHAGIHDAYQAGVERIERTEGVQRAGGGGAAAEAGNNQAACAIFTTDTRTLEAHPHLNEEVFGPSSIVTSCDSAEDLRRIARNLEGHLTATIHGTERDLAEHADLVALLQKKVGRLIFNGFPTGIEVCHAMHHGGPYPATTDPHFTSIGTAAIYRFARPICYQNFPDAALPEALRNRNSRGIWRLVDGEWTKDDA